MHTFLSLIIICNILIFLKLNNCLNKYRLINKTLKHFLKIPILIINNISVISNNEKYWKNDIYLFL